MPTNLISSLMLLLILLATSCRRDDRRDLMEVQKVLEATKLQLENHYQQQGKIVLNLEDLQALKDHSEAAIRGEALLKKLLKRRVWISRETADWKKYHHVFCEKYFLAPEILLKWRELCSISNGGINVCPYDFPEYENMEKRWCVDGDGKS
jgi:uncharacterized Fe-S cluster protein YjdI